MLKTMKNEKICVLGSTGMLGGVVFKFLNENGYNCFGITNDSFVKTSKVSIVDVTSFCDLEKELDRIKPSVLVNCIGLLNKDCDLKTSLAFYLNSVFPHLLNEYCLAKNIYLVHVSTDYIFSGAKDLYSLDSKKDGTGFYSISKSYGEILNSKNALTIRTSLIGPNEYYSEKGLFNWFLLQDSANGFDNVFWSGVTTIQFARFIVFCLENGRPTGIVHLVNGDMISKYDLLELFNSRRVHPISISKVPAERAICIRLEPYCAGFVVPSYKQMIDEMMLWVLEHDSDYRVLANRIKGE